MERVHRGSRRVFGFQAQSFSQVTAATATGSALMSGHRTGTTDGEASHGCTAKAREESHLCKGQFRGEFAPRATTVSHTCLSLSISIVTPRLVHCPGHKPRCSTVVVVARIPRRAQSPLLATAE